MRKTMMQSMNTARLAQDSCAASACSENNSIIIILDAVLASIFVLISILSVRLLGAKATRNMTICQMAPHFA